jgi:hypothetical protein
MPRGVVRKRGGVSDPRGGFSPTALQRMPRAARRATGEEQSIPPRAVKVERCCAVSQTRLTKGNRDPLGPYLSGLLLRTRPKNTNRCHENVRYRNQSSACADSSPNSMVNFIEGAQSGAPCRCQERD